MSEHSIDATAVAIVNGETARIGVEVGIARSSCEKRAGVQRRLALAIEAGDTTCASEPGEFCGYLGSIGFGSAPVCRLFPTADASYTPLREKGGWVQRCRDCLAAERGEVGGSNG